jgi:glycosyltransferase involved in cell wall biosynthesis
VFYFFLIWLAIKFLFDDFWLNNICIKPSGAKQCWEALYVGQFTKNKNIHVSIQAINQLIKKGFNIKFTIVGGGGNYEAQIRKLASKYSNFVTIIDRINSKEDLLELYRKSDFFIMPSRFETFGLVYIEALSQGLPIIYTIDQGVDGYFKDGEVGYATKSNNIKHLIENINKLILNYNDISSRCSLIADKFSWDIISSKYAFMYDELCSKI